MTGTIIHKPFQQRWQAAEVMSPLLEPDVGQIYTPDTCGLTSPQDGKQSDYDTISVRDHPINVMFSYWGRRGALSQLALEVARAALAEPKLAVTISVSRQNESFSAFDEFGTALFPVDTFSSGAGVLSNAWRIPALRRRLAEEIKDRQIEAVIELIPHVWSPFVMPVVRRAKARYITIVHDADAHPGDRTARAKPLLDMAASSSDAVVTFSSAVTSKIVAAGLVPASKVRTLYHPILQYGGASDRHAPGVGAPWRLLFLGRIMPYKGLPLCIEAVELLRSQGQAVELGVFGEGPLEPFGERLHRLGAEVVNRWLSESEIASALSRYDAAVLSYVEASQSGVAAAAHGAGMPVVATPVGGLSEQIQSGKTGIIAERVDARAFADAIKKLFEPNTYETICSSILSSRQDRSMARFVRDIVALR